MAASRHHSVSRAKAGSQVSQPGCSRPIEGVVIDWCAPPSGARVTPEGVPTRIDCPPAYSPKLHGSRARATNGSYITPMGNRGCDQRLQVAPSSPIRPTRFVSAMPSSTCWPVGRSRQCRTVSASSANQFSCSTSAHTPTLFTQPPRFVEELTSGLTVTTRAPTSGAARLRSSRVRPRAACVVAVPEGVRPRSVGTRRAGSSGTSGRRRRAPAAAHSSAAAEPAANGSHGRSGSTPTRAASSCSWLTVSSAEWFCGWPSVANPYPLRVYASTTVGRVSSMVLKASSSAARSCPPRLRTAVIRCVSSRSATRAAMASASGPSPGSTALARSAPCRSSRWYSGLAMSSMRRRRASPPGRANSSVSTRPYFTVSTCQPAAANIPSSRAAPIVGTTRSSDWRLRSTTHTTSPSLATIGSSTASHTAPSSSSASPTRDH